MPELPDVTVYIEHVRRVALGHRLEQIVVGNPFVLRSVSPPAEEFATTLLQSVERLGKRIVLGFTGDRFAVIHLMVAGRLQWLTRDATLAKKRTLAAFVFDHGVLQLTEAGSKRRASLHLVASQAALAEHDPGGREPLEISEAEFCALIGAQNHTLKRALTDPRILSGIGNSYSDEILHHAQLSPVTLATRLDHSELRRLYASTQAVLREWTDRLREQNAARFPQKVTAFRPEMAVHGRYGQPCPRCSGPVQRIVYASRETNYCPACQTGGRLLADRGLSRLLRKDWPRSLEELERRRADRREP
ncbi:MAG: formamidopyrimidine-DNA glycosylase [Myxococcales bacterium FL481]|nr:MAG: formamidopyrimidine-DNA glycosylase [Myxococcales bacterium FL481]